MCLYVCVRECARECTTKKPWLPSTVFTHSTHCCNDAHDVVTHMRLLQAHAQRHVFFVLVQWKEWGTNRSLQLNHCLSGLIVLTTLQDTLLLVYAFLVAHLSSRPQQEPWATNTHATNLLYLLGTQSLEHHLLCLPQSFGNLSRPTQGCPWSWPALRPCWPWCCTF